MDLLLYKLNADEPIIRNTGLTNFPLSFAQERLWFLDQLDPGNPAHNISAALKFNGPLDIPILERSINNIVQHHEILRTIFPAKHDKQNAQILPELSVPLHQIDFRETNEKERSKKIQDLITVDIETGFSISTPPLIRFTLLITGIEEHILLITSHQIISDKVSLRRLIQELSRVYSSFFTNRRAAIQTPAIQFADYSLWQHEWINTERAQQELSYWKKHLDGIPDILPLPTDRPRAAIQNFAGSFITSRLDHEVSLKLKSLCDEEGASLFIGLLSVFTVLLYRYTGEEDILMGCPVEGRTMEQTQSTIGPFTNTVVIRTKLSGNSTFRELLQSMWREWLEVFANQNIPFEKLVQELKPNRSLSHSPLFQVMFSMQEDSPEDYQFPNLQVQRMDIENTGQKVDLTLYAKKYGEKMRLVWKYSTDLFERDRIEKMSEHFTTLISSISENFDQKISQLNLLTEEEKRHLIYDVNQTQSTYPRGSRIEELFQTTVGAWPKSIAVVFGPERLTYEELDQKSNQLARYLMRKGLGPGKVGALFLNRNLHLPIALLGILKTGAAYLPIDPVFLSDRVQYMLTDSGAYIVVSQESIAHRLQISNPIIRIDSEWKSIQAEDPKRIPIQGNSSDLACIIYTSGSTGIPKGVQVMHRSLVNHAFAIINTCGFNAKDRMLQFASISFDQAAEELYPPWLVGARVILRGDEKMSSFLEVLKQIENYKITVLNLPTVYWHELTQEIQTSSLRIPSCIRILIVGGEKAAYSTYKQWRQLAGDTPLFFNTYGPTETTVTATIYEDRKDRIIAEKIQDVPIGRPIANTQIYILDQHLQLVPKGVPGELCIGGDGVSPGYLNQLELTERKFPKNPFLKDSERIYRTGDIVRYLQDGTLQFLGRIDDQVKILGYRIELGDVEAAVAMHEAVLETAVIAPLVSGRKQLVAYVVSRDKSLTSQTLKDFLKLKIPGYMIPQIYVFMNQFPMTASGKVNKQALPIPQEADLQKTHVGPRDEFEIQLTEIWQQILNVSKIGMHDNFFDLGGHSLSALRLFTQIEKVTGKTLPLATLFQAPTIEQLANILREERWNSLWSPLVSIQPQGTKPPVFFMHAIAGNVIGYRQIAYYLDPDQPVYGLQARGLDGMQQPHDKVEEMASDYIRRMQTVQSKGPYHLSGHSSGGLIAFEVARQLHERGEEVGVVALLDTDSPGFIIPEDELDQYPKLTTVYWERIKYHLNHILFKRGRVVYIKKLLMRVRRRISLDLSLAYRERNKTKKEDDLTNNLRVEEAGYKAIRDYTAGNYQGEIIIFLANKRPVGEQIAPEVGWKGFARSVQVIRIPGDHIEIINEPNVRVLAELLQKHLDRSSEEKKKDLQKVLKVSLLSFVYHVLSNSIGGI